MLLAASPQRAQHITPILATLELDVTQASDAATALSRVRQGAPLGKSFGFELLIVDTGSVTGDVGVLLRGILSDRQLD